MADYYNLTQNGPQVLSAIDRALSNASTTSDGILSAAYFNTFFNKQDKLRDYANNSGTVLATINGHTLFANKNYTLAELGITNSGGSSGGSGGSFSGITNNPLRWSIGSVSDSFDGSVEKSFSIVYDNQLSTVSQNPVQNRIITNAINTINELLKHFEVKTDNNDNEYMFCDLDFASQYDIVSFARGDLSVDDIMSAIRVDGTTIAVDGQGRLCAIGGGSGSGDAVSITIDDDLNTFSTNPVKNRVITKALGNKLDSSLFTAENIRNMGFVSGVSLNGIAGTFDNSTGIVNIDKATVTKAINVDSTLNVSSAGQLSVNGKLTDTTYTIEQTSGTTYRLKDSNGSYQGVIITDTNTTYNVIGTPSETDYKIVVTPSSGSATTLTIGAASTGVAGLVTIGTQTLAGEKTFTGKATFNNGLKGSSSAYKAIYIGEYTTQIAYMLQYVGAWSNETTYARFLNDYYQVYVYPVVKHNGTYSRIKDGRDGGTKGIPPANDTTNWETVTGWIPETEGEHRYYPDNCTKDAWWDNNGYRPVMKYNNAYYATRWMGEGTHNTLPTNPAYWEPANEYEILAATSNNETIYTSYWVPALSISDDGILAQSVKANTLEAKSSVRLGDAIITWSAADNGLIITNANTGEKLNLSLTGDVTIENN